MSFSPFLPAFTSPCVLPGSRNPLPCNLLSIFHMKHHNMWLSDYNFIHMIQKDFFIKFGKPQNFCAFFNKDFLWDSSLRTAGSSSLFMGNTGPAILIFPFTANMHKTLPADSTPDFGGKTAGIDGPVC